MAKTKWCYFFGGGKAEGDGGMKNLLGGKGCGLAEMMNMGIPVPPGFTITTEACVQYFKNGGKWPQGLAEEVKASLGRLEKVMEMGFGAGKDPLLVSVRSGARVSMPGMMDTVLNLGLNEDAVRALIAASGNERFAWDSYRRFVQMYGDVVMGVEHHKFEHLLQGMKDKRGARMDTDLTADDLRELVGQYKRMIKEATGKAFPDDAREQLNGSINAVFGSWNNDRAVAYRKMNNIPGDWGTAVTVQSMVFGNMGNDSATGVAFTRDPSTGENRFYGEYLINAQGEDVVAGIRTPHPITREQRLRMDSDLTSMEEELPELYRQLVKTYQRLEKHYRDMQDLEFTVQKGKLFMLQCRGGKRTGPAAVRIAVDMVNEKLITKDEALMRVAPEQLDQLLHPTIDPAAKVELIAKGLPASPGAATGRIVFTAEDAVAWKAKGEKVILVRMETSPEDIQGMAAAQGILTARGGMTSHAAVVGRGMGKTAVVGCGALAVDHEHKTFTVGSTVYSEGDWITIDGSTGRVLNGKVKTVDARSDQYFTTLMGWADKTRRLQVWTNADTPGDAVRAREFGAQGVGLCRTEHMFFGEDRLPIVKKMIMNLNDAETRAACLAQLLPMQRADFYGILKAMEGLPVTIRLLDPPLHEFLPHHASVVEELTRLRALNQEPAKQAELTDVLKKVEALGECNPMLGHRGCRLAITFPEMYDMQSQAIMEAACQLKKEGVNVKPEIMIPIVGHWRELEITRASAERVCAEVQKRSGVKVDYHIGTMIEIPRAALTSAEIAKHADFYSFGTNDLTQMTFGFSRDDVAKFVPAYIEQGILAVDPFQSIDQSGVGKLMEMAIRDGRAVKPNLKIGICGEHGGEDKSVKFCHTLGLNYVSCSPYRVPIARLAAAQAVILERRVGGAATAAKKEDSRMKCGSCKPAPAKAAKKPAKKAVKVVKKAAKKPAVKKAAAKKPAKKARK